MNRNERFITTKVWHDQLAPDALYRAFDASLRKLGLDHVDLYMIHWPSRDMDMAATLEALMSLRERGLTRAIGVCNFNLRMIRRAVEEIGAPIASQSIHDLSLIFRLTQIWLASQEEGVCIKRYSMVLSTAMTMPSSLMPIERPNCSRCQTRMMLVRVSPRPERKEKRIFECPKCNFVNTLTVPDPLEQLVRELRELE